MATNQKVLLQSAVNNLGDGGEVVKVRAGYARNYLLPRGFAVPATAGNLKRVDELKRAAQEIVKKDRATAEELAKKLVAVGGISIERAIGDEGKMYGSVTSKDIEEAYARRGVTADRKRIQLAEPIKQLGSFEVPIKLHTDVVATLTVNVTKKGG